MLPEELWNMELTTMNYSNEKGRSTLKDYSGSKITIIDFWATNCGPCLQTLLKGDTLEGFFNGKSPGSLRIIPVSGENSKVIIKFLERFPHFKPILKGSVIENSSLRQYFPHRMIPHLVWINEKGKIIYITGGDQISKENIAGVLAGSEKYDIEEKKDLLKYDKSKPLFVFQDSAFAKTEISSSLLTGFVKGIPSMSGFMYDSINHITQIRFTNMPIPHIFLFGKNKLELIPQRRWLLPEKISVYGKLVVPLHRVEHSKRDNYFCYQFSYPSSNIDSVIVAMHKDLRRLSGLTMKVIKEVVVCYEVRYMKSRTHTKDKRFIRIHQVRDLLNRNNNLTEHFLSLDENDSLTFDISLKKLNQAKNLEEVISLLNNAGLELIKQRKELEFLEFTSDSNF